MSTTLKANIDGLTGELQINGTTVLSAVAAGVSIPGTLSVTGVATAANLVALGSANQKQFVNAAGTAPEWAKGLKVNSITRDVSLASGNVSYTGVGFKPSAIILFHAGTGLTDGSWGFSDGTNDFCIFQPGSAAMGADTKVVYAYQTAGNRTYGTIFSFDADGFTIAWTKIGSPTGSISIGYLALR
jgi:hypothetical protein